MNSRAVMDKVVVTVVYPGKSESRKAAPSRVVFSRNIDLPPGSDIYSAVEQFSDDLSPVSFDGNKGVPLFHDVPLGDVINLHNLSGIRDRKQILEMARKIELGKEIYDSRGLPNIKLLILEGALAVLFDGHHSFLAYMLAGRENLSEIPHFLVSGPLRDGLPQRALLPCYGPYACQLMEDAWRSTVINWQAPRGQQLEKRKQHDMEELLSSYLKEEPCV
ncbi:MAG: hypothetical protein ACLFN4_00580 [Candidatus Acetothermia bacterium]